MPTNLVHFNPDGTFHFIHSDAIAPIMAEVDAVTETRRASNVEFNNATRLWEVRNLSGAVLRSFPLHAQAIAWEIETINSQDHYEPRRGIEAPLQES